MAVAGVSQSEFRELSSFQQLLLEVAVARYHEHGRAACYGLGMRDDLEDLLDRDVNHGRLYPNLDDLVSEGLLEKEELDKRTNAYVPTDEAARLVAQEHRRRREMLPDGVLDEPHHERVTIADGSGGDR